MDLRVLFMLYIYIYRTAKAHTYIHMHASIKKRSYVGRLGRKSFHIFQLSVEWIFVFCRCVPLCIVDVRVRSAFTRFPTYRLGLFFPFHMVCIAIEVGEKSEPIFLFFAALTPVSYIRFFAHGHQLSRTLKYRKTQRMCINGNGTATATLAILHTESHMLCTGTHVSFVQLISHSLPALSLCGCRSLIHFFQQPTMRMCVCRCT